MEQACRGVRRRLPGHPVVEMSQAIAGPDKDALRLRLPKQVESCSLFYFPQRNKILQIFRTCKSEVRVGYKPASQTKHHAGAGSADIELYSPFLIGMILSKALGYRNFNLLRSEISDLLRCNIFGVRFSIPSPEGIKK